MWICDGHVSVRSTCVVVEEERVARRAGRVRRRERELVEVVLDRLDLAVVAHLVAEPEERVLDGAPHLRDRMEVAERQLLARQRDVEHLVAQAPVELLVGELVLPLGDRGLETLADPVQEHPALAIAHLAQRKREVALAAEVLDAHLLERRRGRGSDRVSRLGS